MMPHTLLRAHTWNGCNLTYSSFHELTASAVQWSGTVGIKYVIEGTEHYGLQGHNHFVRDRQYLLVNEKRPFDIEMPFTRTPVRGMCITLSSAFLSDAERCLSLKEEQLLDHPENDKSASVDFTELIHPAGDALSNLLSGLTAHLDPQTGRVAGSDELLFANIAEALLVSQRKLRKVASSLDARRASTRVELYRRIALAKTIMDDAPETVENIAVLAQEAALSEFHFMRCFRQLFGLSPHQYILRRRIQKAADLLTKNVSITEAALLCGFSDVQSFSKAFRKQFGCAPSRFR